MVATGKVVIVNKLRMGLLKNTLSGDSADA